MFPAAPEQSTSASSGQGGCEHGRGTLSLLCRALSALWAGAEKSPARLFYSHVPRSNKSARASYSVAISRSALTSSATTAALAH